jgi:hypothetical protein
VSACAQAIGADLKPDRKSGQRSARPDDGFRAHRLAEAATVLNLRPKRAAVGEDRQMGGCWCRRFGRLHVSMLWPSLAAPSGLSESKKIRLVSWRFSLMMTGLGLSPEVHSVFRPTSQLTEARLIPSECELGEGRSSNKPHNLMSAAAAVFARLLAGRLKSYRSTFLPSHSRMTLTACSFIAWAAAWSRSWAAGSAARPWAAHQSAFAERRQWRPLPDQ